jgi:NitT/TauT family transport system substrate-binding protein
MPRWLLPALLAAAVVFFVAFFLLQTAQAPFPKLRIGLLPVVDALPFVVAEKEGLFERACLWSLSTSAQPEIGTPP